jgi:site-specific DNA-methyltransferase (adenine-specific)
MKVKKNGVGPMMSKMKRAERNRTLDISSEDISKLSSRLLQLSDNVEVGDILDRTICQDVFDTLPFLPDAFVDLLFIDPPYNMDKQFNGRRFSKTTTDNYQEWVDKWLSQLRRLLKPTASVYICADWLSSSSVHAVAAKYFKIRNRITWEREKGRGALRNWKNCSEDIWFCTVSDNYTFNVNAVKLKRRVIAPYTKKNGDPKDWEKSRDGNFRLTFPSNLWTDLTVPFWSMPENTDHPTQKPEKLVAKVLLASSNPGDVVLDPFLGSGTTSVVAKKLARRYVGIEVDKTFCCLAEKRLDIAENDRTIQGYSDNVFWERNALQDQKRSQKRIGKCESREGCKQPSLFSVKQETGSDCNA